MRSARDRIFSSAMPIAQRRCMRVRAVFALALLACSAAALAATAAKVEYFSPQFTVKDVRQVAVRFSEAMVAFGDPRLPEPFIIDCPVAGRARWADSRNWVYDFETDLDAGSSCRFTLKPDLERPRSEWFLAGTEMSAVELLTQGGEAPRIASPANGVVIALDPDIPRAHQKLVIESRGAAAHAQLYLDDVLLAAAGERVAWFPLPG